MQLKLVDPATRQVYPMRDDVYLRGSVVTWYSQNHWRRDPPPNSSEQIAERGRRTRRPIASARATSEAMRHSASALPWCSRLPWNPTWIATIYSTSGRWWNPSARQIWLYCPVHRPTGAEAQFQRRAPRRQFQVRSADQRAGRRASGPADSGEPGGPRRPTCKCPAIAASAPADGPGRALAAGKRPAAAQTLRSRPLVRAATFQFRPVPLHPARPGARHVDRRHRRLRFQQSPRTLRVLCHGPGPDAPQPGNTVAGRVGLSLRRVARGPAMLPGPPVARARLGRGLPRPTIRVPGSAAAERADVAGCMAAGCDWIRRRRPKWAPRPPSARCGAPGRDAGTACNATGTSTSWTWIASSNASRSMSRFPGRRETSPANCSIPAGGENLRQACGPPWPQRCEAVSWDGCSAWSC